MSKSTRMLVAIDFSPQSAVALTEAFEQAARIDAKVHLLHVFTLQEKRERDLTRVGLADARAVERTQLAAAADAYRASEHLGEVIWRDGDPGPQIVSEAERLHVDMVVLGASGRTGLTRVLLGSVADWVTRYAPCSVWVVRAKS